MERADMRWYAQRGQNVIRNSCVGCGICSAVCPRGVLKLESGPKASRFNQMSLVQVNNGSIDVASNEPGKSKGCSKGLRGATSEVAQQVTVAESVRERSGLSPWLILK